MASRGESLRTRLAAALALGLGACAGGDDVVDPGPFGELCDGDSILGFLTPAEPVEYLAVRKVFEGEELGEESDVWGEPCAGASDTDACLDTLATTWPESEGWGYCGSGCTDTGLAYTRGDEVGMADSVDEVIALLGTIDSAADAMMVALASDYQPECTSVVQTVTGWSLVGEITTNDCPWTDETRMLSITTAGELAVEEVIEIDETDGCAGRRPDGLSARGTLRGTSVGCQLAHIAHLEGAAVIAFERVAAELERFGAPKALVARSRRAARDEVRHARQVGRMARAYGATLAPVEVEPLQERSLFAFALENAVEGCVRETYGVVDAMFRASCASDARIRSLFARIAEDEARHAELSWAIHDWLMARLSAAERRQIDVAMSEAHAELCAEIERAARNEVDAVLGAPTAVAGVAMASALSERRAA